MRTLYNLGCGDVRGDLPKLFQDWKEVRVDADPSVKPDIVADLTDLGVVATESADAVWASHCLEHLYAFEQRQALLEIRRILKPSGYAVITVPDLQAMARLIAEDKIDETAYQSAAGPITVHDMIFGHGASVQAGKAGMAHRCAFSPNLAHARLEDAGLSAHALIKRPSFQLLCLAFKDPDTPRPQIRALLESLTA